MNLFILCPQPTFSPTPFPGIPCPLDILSMVLSQNISNANLPLLSLNYSLYLSLSLLWQSPSYKTNRLPFPRGPQTRFPSLPGAWLKPSSCVLVEGMCLQVLFAPSGWPTGPSQEPLYFPFSLATPELNGGDSKESIADPPHIGRLGLDLTNNLAESYLSA